MKKVLISLLLVCFTLCLFIGCDGSAMNSFFREEPTTKTISVIENNEEKFNFNILTTSKTTWGEVIDVQLEDDWDLDVNDKNGRLELKNGTTYYITTELGEKFLTSTDIIGDTPTIYMVNPKNYTLKEKDTWFSTLVDGTTPAITKNQITEIHFVKKYTPSGTPIVNGKDLKQNEKGKVKGYIVDSDTSSMYEIYIVGDYIFGNENCSQMFDNFSGLTSIDFDSFDTSSVTNMRDMFSYCEGLTSLDLSGFDTSNVTDMSNMFSSCNVITSLDLSGFDTSNVTDMSNMFTGCQKLPLLNLSNFNTSKVDNMSSMFNGCSSLTELDLSNFNISSVDVENPPAMFINCGKSGTKIKVNTTNKSFFEKPSLLGDTGDWTYNGDITSYIHK